MCFEAQKWISVTVDNERLPGAVSSSLSAHLASCPSCQRALAEETKRCQLLGAALQEPATSLKLLSAAILEKARRDTALGDAALGDTALGERTLPSKTLPSKALPSETLPSKTLRWRIASWAAAALLLFSSSWLVVGIIVKTSNLVPVVRGRSADGPSPFNVFVEQDLLQRDVVPSDDGSPFQRERHMQRRTLLDDLSPGRPAPAGAARPRAGWDLERMDLRYERLIKYPYQ